MNRRGFLAATSSAAASAVLLGQLRAAEQPALLGGRPVRTASFPAWPRVCSADEEAVREVVQTGRWYRSRSVEQFELEFARLNDAKYCVATASGTTALFTSLGALGIGPGDEVIIPPYTFMATASVVLLHHALPVFVDSDPETFLMDPGKLEAAITARTAAILPVHIGGSVADLDRILAVAEKHKLPVVGDACQAHLAQWRGRSAGSWGTTGCYSFQLSKNLCAGEGGAILTNDEALADACFGFHNCCRKRTTARPEAVYRGGRNGNFRMTEFQGALLTSQMQGIAERAEIRSRNAAYLTSLLGEIAGITPAKMYEGCTRHAWHIYMFRYDRQAFAGLAREQFVRALRAEGIPCATGYRPLNKAEFIRDALHSRPYLRVYGKETIDAWAERNTCPQNDRLCEEAVWFMQNLLLGSPADMEQIAEAISKIQKHAGALARA